MKLSHVSISIVFTLLLSVVMVVSVEPVNAESNVILLSDSSYVNSGTYYIFGEVQNTGDTAVKYVKITATYYDSNDNVLVTDYTYSDLDILLPNAKSAYTVILLNEADIEQIDHYTLSLHYSETAAPEQALSILSHSSYISNTGALHVTGEIKNNGDSTSTYTIIYATFYDAQGKVVATDLTFPEPEDMPAGATETFDVLYIEYDRVPSIASYSLTAESDQYSLLSINGVSTTTEPTPTPTIPETSIVAALMALFIVTGCSMLLLKSKVGKKQ